MSIKLSLTELLAHTTPQTTEAESARMLTSIETAHPVPVIPSPFYTSYYFSFKPMSYIALTLVLLLGATGTVAASGAAKPGDLLFPIERATEEVRIALASDTAKEALKNQFIGERFAELHEIVAEETIATTTGTTTGTVLRAAGESRVANAIAILANQLADETDSATREQFLRDLLDEVDTLHVAGRDTESLRLDGARIKIDNNRTEVRTQNERIKIEHKDGNIEIKYESRGRGTENGAIEKVSSEGTSTDEEHFGRGSNEDTDINESREEESFMGISTTSAGVHTQFEVENEASVEHHGGGMNGNSGKDYHESDDGDDE